MDGVKVTAVVLNYNSSKDCEKCITFLSNQDYENKSIIVVDNGSPNPNEKEFLRDICLNKNAKLILNPVNAGFSAGNNVGLRAAVEDGAEWMLVINPDVELRDPHYISYVMGQLPNWPETAVIGTNTLLPNGERQNPMRELTFLEEVMWPLETLKQKIGIWDGYRTEDVTGYCEKVSGCCFFISKFFLEQINYLDESVFMYCEEPILAKCVQKLGYRELYLNDVTAYHEHYKKDKYGTDISKILYFFESRIYYIKHYSNYGFLKREVAILSRKIQKLVWRNLK